ncbi:protein BatD [Litorilituus sediminis]|uniref:Protein BatD n=2 Tax=Litorilituus sediminis TaxID=718192 RepID=A0A4P6PDB3_9GAMM|nr:protein BatD [Litorilituus sediminis]
MLFILATLFSQGAFALTQVTASVDKNPAMVNESIVLTVIANDDVNRNALDTSPLKADFIVGQTSVSSQTSMVNFKTSRTTQWQIVLIAKKAGKITIPALSVDNITSNAIELTVLEQNAAGANNQQDIFITSELSASEVYVQQLLTLTLKLHFAVELKSGNLTEPAIPGATIEKIGQDQQSDGIINGKRYRIIEQTYAITPEQSGTFEIAAPLFSGEVMMPSRRRSNFLSFAETKPVSILGDTMSLTVRPIPASFNQSNSNNQWLPSELLTLHQEWQTTHDKFTVGEPITRTITLTAAGLSKAQLPEIKMATPKGLKVYPDQAQLHSNLSKERLVSQKIQNFAIVASKPGTYELPAIEITWFNTVTNKIARATLPAQSITVHASEDSNQQYTENRAVEPSQAPLAASKAQQPSPTIITDSTSINVWLVALLTLLWLLTVLAWYFHVRALKQRQPVEKVTTSVSNSGQYYLKLLAACKQNNAKLALELLLPWLNQLLYSSNQQKITDLAQAQAVVKNNDFDSATNSLLEYLYGKSAQENKGSWQGKALLQAIEVINKQQHTTSSSSTVQLNP